MKTREMKRKTNTNETMIEKVERITKTDNVR